MTMKNTLLKVFLLAFVVVGVGTQGVGEVEATAKSTVSTVNDMPALSYHYNWAPFVGMGPHETRADFIRGSNFYENEDIFTTFTHVNLIEMFDNSVKSGSNQVPLVDTVSCRPSSTCGWLAGLNPTTAKINYSTELINTATNRSISDGARLPVGTKFKVQRKNSLGDISWNGTGSSQDSPYGIWVDRAGPTSIACTTWNESNFGLSFGVHIMLNVAPPATSVVSNNSNVTCSGNICEVKKVGPIQVGMSFPATFGHFYYRYYDYRLLGSYGQLWQPGCKANNVPMRKSNNSAGSVVDGSTYRVNFPESTITFSLTGISNPINTATCKALDAPNSVTTGSTFQATAAMVNTGNTTWTTRSGYSLNTQSTRWGSIAFSSLGGVSILPNNTALFQRNFTAPPDADTYDFNWRMSVSGVPFGKTCTKRITVTAATCTGNKPTNSTYHNGDTVGLSGNTAATYNLNGSKNKCEYFCNKDFKYSSGSCVPVTPPPNVVLTASPATIEAGDSSTLTWTVSGRVSSCLASFGWSGARSTSGGSTRVSPLTNNGYRLTCVGPGGNGVGNALIAVTNDAPVVSAGSDRIITLPTSRVSPVGASASDPNTPLTYSWIRVSAPVGAPAPSIVNANTLSPVFSNLTTVGVYTFRLTVRDSLNALNSDLMTVTVNPAALTSCSALPTNYASFHAGDEVVAVNTQSTYSSTNNPAVQCEFSCNLAYVWANGSCVLPDLTAENVSPNTGSVFNTSDPITFTGLVRNSATAPVAQAGWADLQIDWFSDGPEEGSDNNYNAYVGNAMVGPLAQNESKNLSRTIAAGVAPAGQHRYRFHVDTNGAGVIESNDNNNKSPWRTFIVNGVPENRCGSAINTTHTAAPASNLCAVGTPTSISGSGPWTWNCAGSPNPSVSCTAAVTPFTPPTRPDVPTGLTATPGLCGTNSIVLTWNSADRADEYEVMVNNIINNVGNTTISTNNNLNPGETYSYEVRAKNSKGTSDWSTPPASATVRGDCPTVTPTLTPPDLEISVVGQKIIRPKGTTEVEWSISTDHPLACTVSGGISVPEFPVSSSDFSASQLTTELYNKTLFYLECTDANGDVHKAETSVEVIPDFQET